MMRANIPVVEVITERIAAMAVDHIRYDILAQEALRGVVRTVLADAAKHGLPGEHHFYITFKTRAEGVRLSPRMLAQYPQEMTIVLQHQFWDLVTTEDGFEVGLSFGGITERLSIPLAAIKGFYDPSVEFGLQFEEIGASTAEKPAEEAGQEVALQNTPAARAASEQKPAAALPAVPAPVNPEQAEGGPTMPTEVKPEDSAQVVRLDRFRKK
jgi:hypothetical protein